MRIDIVKNSYGWFLKYQGGEIVGPYSTIRLAIENIYETETNAERYISAEPGYVLTTADKLEILKVLDFYNSDLKAKTADQIVDMNFSVMDYINKNIASGLQQHIDKTIETIDNTIETTMLYEHDDKDKIYKCKIAKSPAGLWYGYIDDTKETGGYYTKFFCMRAVKKAVKKKRSQINKEVIEFEL